VATVDIPDAAGNIDDASRITYTKQHLKGVSRAIEEGIPVKSYYYWSLMDNYE